MKQLKKSQGETITQLTDTLGLSRTTVSRTQRSFNKTTKLSEFHPSTVLTETDELESTNRNLVTASKRTSQTKERSSRLIRHKKFLSRMSDNFNVYKAPEALETNPEVLKVKKKHYRYTKEIIQFYLDDTKLLKEQPSIMQDENLLEKQLHSYYAEAWTQLESLMRRINNLMVLRSNRERCEQEMREILIEALKQKNLCVQQRISYLFGKIEQLFYNPIQAIFYFKICKRLSDGPLYVRMKMKSYRGLGECFIRLRPQLSQLYLTKYLMLAWKLNEKNDELLAYELLGKHHYYIGQIEKARMYHEKMLNGHGEVRFFYNEEPNSRVRELALRRLEQAAQTHKNVNKDQLTNDIDQVSSDDECYDLVFQDTPKSVVFSMPNKQKQFNQKLPDLQIVKEQANQNIRQKKEKYKSLLLNGEFDLSKLQISSPHLSIGQIKDKVLISHMTPNRKLEMYQYICLASDKNGNQNSHLLTGLYDAHELTKSMKYTTALLTQFRTAQQWITQQQKGNGQSQMNSYQMLQSTFRRRAYVIA